MQLSQELGTLQNNLMQPSRERGGLQLTLQHAMELQLSLQHVLELELQLSLQLELELERRRSST